jgi:hypothetical protein
MNKLSKFGLAALIPLAIMTAATQSIAQIKAYTLPEMTAEADNVVYGQITGSRVFRIDHEVDGPELYFTVITVQGNSLVDGSDLTVDVTFNGGFIDEDNGVYNSEAPAADDVKLGNNVALFYKWSDNLGGDVKGNGLLAMHGGIYRSVSGRTGPIILGRGDGYSIKSNISMDNLTKAITKLKGDREPDKQEQKR